MVLLVRNRVKNVDHWKRVFDEQEAGAIDGQYWFLEEFPRIL